MMSIHAEKTDHIPTRAQAVAMVAAPALLLAGFATHPSDEGTSIEVLRTISENHGTWTFSHALLFAAAVLLIPAVIALGRLVTGPARRVAAIGAGLVVLASTGLAGAAAFEQLIGIAATLEADAGAMARLLDAAKESTILIGTLMVPQAMIVVGFLALAWALFRAGVLPIWSALVLAIGSAGLMAPEPARCIGTAMVLSAFVVSVVRSVRTSVPDSNPVEMAPVRRRVNVG